MKFGLFFGFLKGGNQAGLSEHPTPSKSIIIPNETRTITVNWDRTMSSTCDISNQISVIINGGTPITNCIVSIKSTNSIIMTIVLVDTDFTKNDTVKWYYSHGACTLHQKGSIKSEAEETVHDVSNHVDDTTFDMTIVRYDNTKLTMDKGI